MPTDFSPRDPLIDSLVADLRPVTPRHWGREALLLLALGSAEIIAFVSVSGVRGDMPHAMAEPAFWWKSGSLAVIALLALAAALLSLDPASGRSRQLPRLWAALGIALALALGTGWMIDAGSRGGALLLERLDWHEGMACVSAVAVLSLPLVLVMGVLMRRGASIQPGRTAFAAGLAAAGFAAFVFAFHCDHDDPFYVAVWYGVAVSGIAALARLALPRLTRW